MGESRDENDPRDLLRAMNKRARAEFEESQTGDTGGQEHARGQDRAGLAAREEEDVARAGERVTREQGDARTLRKPAGDAGSSGSQRTAGPTGEE